MMTAPDMELRRPKEGPPTTTDFYYGKPIGTDYPIAPMNVKTYQGKFVVDFGMGIEPHPVDLFYWYGKVPICVESNV